MPTSPGRGTESILGVYKSGNVYWHYKGKRYEESLSTDSRRMAEELYAKALTAILWREYDKPEMQVYTFGELVEEYKKMYCRQKSFRGKNGYIRLFCRAWGDMPLSEFSTKLIESYQSTIIEKGKAYGDIKRSFNTACRKAGIRDFHFHDLRHTFSSHLIMGGTDITILSRLLGHKSLTMTLRYSHLASAHLKQAVQSLNYYDFTTVPGSKEFTNATTC